MDTARLREDPSQPPRDAAGHVAQEAVQHLSQVLWRERELLDELAYALEVEQLILASGRTRWLVRSAGSVETVLGDLRRTELLRAVAADAVAAAFGFDANPSLRQLATELPEPWTEIFTEHREALVKVTQEITALADSNRELITSGYRSARETLLSLGEGTEGYAPDGSAVTATTATGSARVDFSI